jgi:hypothetical protein
MNRKFPAMACLLLVATSALTACYDDRPGRHRPPHDRHDRDHDRDHGHDRHDRDDRRPR